jgi:hypothetical protein
MPFAVAVEGPAKIIRYTDAKLKNEKYSNYCRSRSKS